MRETFEDKVDMDASQKLRWELLRNSKTTYEKEHLLSEILENSNDIREIQLVFNNSPEGSTVETNSFYLSQGYRIYDNINPFYF